MIFAIVVVGAFNQAGESPIPIVRGNLRYCEIFADLSFQL